MNVLHVMIGKGLSRVAAMVATALMCAVSQATSQGSPDTVAALRDSLRAARAAVDSLSHPQKQSGESVEQERRRPAIIFQGLVSNQSPPLLGVSGTLHVVGPFGVSLGIGRAGSGRELEYSIVGEFPSGSFIPFPLWARLGMREQGFWEDTGMLNDYAPGTIFANVAHGGWFVDAGAVVGPGPWHVLVAGRKWSAAGRNPELMLGALYRVP
jgi:hypothetical protein